jgi:hypothetical protein
LPKERVHEQACIGCFSRADEGCACSNFLVKSLTPIRTSTRSKTSL